MISRTFDRWMHRYIRLVRSNSKANSWESYYEQNVHGSREADATIARMHITYDILRGTCTRASTRTNESRVLLHPLFTQCAPRNFGEDGRSILARLLFAPEACTSFGQNFMPNVVQYFQVPPSLFFFFLFLSVKIEDKLKKI